MKCPILPVGQAVVGPLPVPSQVARAINEALARRGYLSGSLDGYDRTTAEALARFQDDHPIDTAPDTVLSQVTGESGLRFASCATYAALDVPCSEVEWSVPIWEPVIGRDRALAAGLAIAAAKGAGLVRLTCPVVTVVGPTPGGQPMPSEGTSPWIWVAGIGALLWLSRQRRRA